VFKNNYCKFPIVRDGPSDPSDRAVYGLGLLPLACMPGGGMDLCTL